MRKKIGYLVIIFALIGTALVSYNSSKQTITNPEAREDNSRTTQDLLHKVKIGNWSVLYSDFFEGDSVNLAPNFEDQTPARELFNKNNCKVLVNGGFYRQIDDEPYTVAPIGLFVGDYVETSAFQSNRLFNGVLSVNDMATPRITLDVPRDRQRLALQTGPVLIQNTQAQKLETNDNQARRMVAIVSGENKIAFLAIYKEDSTYMGPTLSSLPEVLKDFESQTGIQIADAINLDGGTASAIISTNLSLNELSPIGSFFCMN